MSKRILKADAATGSATVQYFLYPAPPVTEAWVSFDVIFSPEALAWLVTHGDTIILAVMDDASNNAAILVTGVAGGLGVGGDPLAVWASTAGGSCDAPTPDTAWHTVEYHYHQGVVSELYIDGVVRWSVAPVGSHNLNEFALGPWGTFGADAPFYFDNVKIGTTRHGTEILGDDFTSGTFAAWSAHSPNTSIIDVPTNDNYADAAAIGPGSGSIGGTTVGATSEATEDDLYGAYANKSVWYTYAADADGGVLVTVDGLETDGTVMVQESSTDIASFMAGAFRMSPIDQGGGVNGIYMTVRAGHTYHIRVSSNTEGFFTLSYAYTAPPANDDWADAELIADSGTIAGDLSGAISEGWEPLGDDGDPGESSLATNDRGLGGSTTTWYKWIAPGDGRLLLSVPPALPVHTLLAVFEDDKTFIKGGHRYYDDNTLENSKLALMVESGNTYYIRVNNGPGYCDPVGVPGGTVGAFILSWQFDEGAGKERYIDWESGDNANDGLTTETPWQTTGGAGIGIFHGYDIGPGYTFYHKGRLLASVDTNLIDPAQPWCFGAEGDLIRYLPWDEGTVVDGASEASIAAPSDNTSIHEAGYGIFEGFHFEAGTYAYLNCSFLTLSECTFAARSAAYVIGDDCLIDSNEFEKDNYYHPYSCVVDDDTAERMRVQNNTFRGIGVNDSLADNANPTFPFISGDLNDVKVINNTFYNLGLSDDWVDVIEIYGDAGGEVANNIFDSVFGNDGGVVENDGAGTISFHHNLLHTVQVPLGIDGIVSDDGGNVTGDSRLDNAPMGQLHVRSNSAAAGIGDSSVAPAKDKDGVTRGTPPSAGAYEPDPPVVPPPLPRSEMEQAWQELEPPGLTQYPWLFPVDSDTMWGSMRKVFADYLQQMPNALSRWWSGLNMADIVTDDGDDSDLAHWERMLGIPVNPVWPFSLRKTLLQVRWFKGPFTRARRLQIIELFLMAFLVTSSDIPIEFGTDGMVFEDGGTSFGIDLPDLAGTYSVTEDIPGFSYQVNILDTYYTDGFDDSDLARELDRITPDPITFTIVSTPTP